MMNFPVKLLRLYPAQLSPRLVCRGAALFEVPANPCRPRPYLTLEVVAAWCGVGLLAVLAAYLDWSGGGFLLAAGALIAVWFQGWLLPRYHARLLRSLAGHICLVRYFDGPYASVVPVDQPDREFILPAALLARRFGPKLRPQDTLIHHHRILRILQVDGLAAVVQEALPSARPEQLPLIELLQGRGTLATWPSLNPA